MSEIKKMTGAEIKKWYEFVWINDKETGPFGLSTVMSFAEYVGVLAEPVVRYRWAWIEIKGGYQINSGVTDHCCTETEFRKELDADYKEGMVWPGRFQYWRLDATREEK